MRQAKDCPKDEYVWSGIPCDIESSKGTLRSFDDTFKYELPKMYEPMPAIVSKAGNKWLAEIENVLSLSWRSIGYLWETVLSFWATLIPRGDLAYFFHEGRLFRASKNLFHTLFNCHGQWPWNERRIWQFQARNKSRNNLGLSNVVRAPEKTKQDPLAIQCYMGWQIPPYQLKRFWRQGGSRTGFAPPR